MIIREKAFIQALSIFSTDPEKSKSFLKDKRLNLAEKKILRCYFLLRNNMSAEVIAELETITNDITQVVESQKQLLLGLAYNNLCEHTKAIKHIQEAQSLMKDQGLAYFEMIGLINLFIINANRKDAKAMTEIIQKLETVTVTQDRDRLRILQCLFQYNTFIRNQRACHETLDRMHLLERTMSEADRVNYLTCKFEYHVQFDEIDKCSLVLEEMKHHRKFNNTQNYTLMKLLLTHYLDHKPIYFDEKEFADYPVSFLQIKVIQQFEEGNKARALEFWNQLKAINPAIYMDDFRFEGGVSIFSLCLNKYTDKPELIIETTAETKYENLYNILSKATAPIRKELLFELLWGYPATEKSDFVKLAQCLYMVRKKFRIEVKSRKGSYYLEKSFITKKKIS